jgi:YD repeat-containing protein
VAYNNLNQMTGILTSTQGTNGFPVGSASPGQALFNIVTYNFSATRDNGQIMSMVDARQGGNTVSYTYDPLKRPTNARTTAWTQAITYDGFSNIATKTVPIGSAEPTFPGVNSANNQLSGATYDANGNMTAMPSGGPALAYDYENRAKSATMGSFVESYAYDESADQAGLSQATVCEDVRLLTFVTDNFPVNHVLYDLLGKTAPNSNSFIRFLSTFVPGLLIVQPNGAVGWDHLVMGQ